MPRRSAYVLALAAVLVWPRCAATAAPSRTVPQAPGAEDGGAACDAPGAGGADPAPPAAGGGCGPGPEEDSAVQLMQVRLSARGQPAFAIAHQTNTVDSASWALKLGVNALEMDLAFQKEVPDRFQHSQSSVAPCDCSTCYATCTLGTVSLVGHPCDSLICNHISTSKPCQEATPAGTMFAFLAKQTPLAMVYLDTKTDTIQGNLTQAGVNLANLLIAKLFRAGYKGFVIVNGEKLGRYDYLGGVTSVIKGFRYDGRVFYTFDSEPDRATEVLRALARLSKYRAYSVGITACSPKTYYDQVALAAYNYGKGTLSLGPVVWTVDHESTMAKYIDFGARSIMSNVPSRVVAALLGKGFALSKPGDFPPPASSSLVFVPPSHKCDCNYHAGGCSISVAASAGMACRCKYMGAWTCAADVVVCLSPTAPACKAPDTSAAACAQGGGDCGGYSGKDGCDCDYHKGGCTISKAAAKYSACKCTYKGAWTCGGSVVRCLNDTSVECSSPSLSKTSCLLGGGDCSGY